MLNGKPGLPTQHSVFRIQHFFVTDVIIRWLSVIIVASWIALLVAGIALIVWPRSPGPGRSSRL